MCRGRSAVAVNLLCLALAQGVPQATSHGFLAFAGAAGCDVTDHDCSQDSSSAEVVLWQYSLTPAGTLIPLSKLSLAGVPAWLATAPQLPQCLFATLVTVNAVAAFEITSSGAQPRGAPVPSGGVHPVYASITQDGAWLLVANYHGPDDGVDSTGASVASFRIGADCTLTLVSSVPHSGSSVVHGRQEAAHPHSLVPAREMGIAYACDLGQDIIFTYAVLDGGLKELHRTHAQPGDGPRHLVEHPYLPIAFVVNEIASTVALYAVEKGSILTRKIAVSTLPPGTPNAGSKAAEIAISPDGTKLYATNRGLHNSVCVFNVLVDGSLKQTQQILVSPYPRGMTLAFGGSLLLVAGQHSGVVQTFIVDTDGKVSWTGVNVTGPPTAAGLAVASPTTAARQFV